MENYQYMKLHSWVVFPFKYSALSIRIYSQSPNYQV